MAILARHWNILPALGLPMPPSVDRLPACLTAHSVAPIEQEETEEGAADGELEEDYSEEESSNSDSDDDEEEAAEEEESGSGDGDDVEEAAAGGSRGAKRGRA